MDGYRETGSLQPLDIESQSADSLRSRLGLRAAIDGHMGAVSITPYAGAYWQHEFQEDEFAISSRFANGAGNEFTVYGPKTGRDSVLLNAGINFGWRDYALYLAYQADLGRKNYEEQTVLLGLRLLW
jgi:outer membrane autotransporter protein